LDVFGTTPRVFDPAKVRRDFAKSFRMRLRDDPKHYPPAIYAEIADPRMFALNVVSPRVLEMIKAYVAQCHKRYKQDGEARSARRRKLISENPWLRGFSYHDDGIVSFRRVGKDMVMKLETPVRLTFKNATILRRDGPVRGNNWCYEEVRPLARGYEVEIFTWGRVDRLVILRCDDIEIANLPSGTPGYALPEGD